MAERKAAAVLVVDDDPEACWVQRTLLSREGVRVVVAGSGAEALARLGETPFALVLVDAKLGDMEGAELARRIRRETSCRASLVLVSGYFNRDDPLVQAWLRDGLFVAFVAKPFLHEDFIRTVGDALARGGRTPSMAVPP